MNSPFFFLLKKDFPGNYLIAQVNHVLWVQHIAKEKQYCSLKIIILFVKFTRTAYLEIKYLWLYIATLVMHFFTPLPHELSLKRLISEVNQAFLLCCTIQIFIKTNNFQCVSCQLWCFFFFISYVHQVVQTKKQTTTKNPLLIKPFLSQSTSTTQSFSKILWLEKWSCSL